MKPNKTIFLDIFCLHVCEVSTPLSKATKVMTLVEEWLVKRDLDIKRLCLKLSFDSPSLVWPTILLKLIILAMFDIWISHPTIQQNLLWCDQSESQWRFNPWPYGIVMWLRFQNSTPIFVRTTTSESVQFTTDQRYLWTTTLMFKT